LADVEVAAGADVAAVAASPAAEPTLADTGAGADASAAPLPWLWAEASLVVLGWLWAG
jgi:hypothetical protein